MVGDTAEKIHTIAKMVLHKNFQYPQPPNDIGNVHIFSEYKTFFANQWDSEKKKRFENISILLDNGTDSVNTYKH